MDLHSFITVFCSRLRNIYVNNCKFKQVEQVETSKRIYELLLLVVIVIVVVVVIVIVELTKELVSLTLTKFRSCTIRSCRLKQ